jgi:hypothetical protein
VRPRDRRSQVGTVLVVVAVALFVVPALFPVQPMLVHDTGRTTNAPPEQLEDDEVEIIAYENLSDRGQRLYRQTLENDGEYRVNLNEGAADFDYPTPEERSEARRGDVRPQPGRVVVERPEESDLPPADERYFGPRGEENEDINETERRQEVVRYDMMFTATEDPPLGTAPQLLRLGAVLLAVALLGVGGYLLSSK